MFVVSFRTFKSSLQPEHAGSVGREVGSVVIGITDSSKLTVVCPLTCVVLNNLLQTYIKRCFLHLRDTIKKSNPFELRIVSHLPV